MASSDVYVLGNDNVVMNRGGSCTGMVQGVVEGCEVVYWGREMYPIVGKHFSHLSTQTFPDSAH